MPTQLAIQITYEDTLHNLEVVAQKFHKDYGGDLEEIRADALLHWMHAYEKYDPHRGARFDTWINYYIYRQLQRENRYRVLRKMRLKELPLIEVVTQARFDLDMFLSELSDDAQRCVNLVLDPPKHIRKELDEKKPATFKDTLRRYLSNVGWTTRRITESFSEIQTALGYGRDPVKITTQKEVKSYLRRVRRRLVIRVPTKDKRGPFLCNPDEVAGSCIQIRESVFDKMKQRGELELCRVVDDGRYAYREYKLATKKKRRR